MIIEIVDGEAVVIPIFNDVIVRDYDVKATDEYELDEDGIPYKEYVCTKSN